MVSPSLAAREKEEIVILEEIDIPEVFIMKSRVLEGETRSLLSPRSFSRTGLDLRRDKIKNCRGLQKNYGSLGEGTVTCILEKY